MFDHLPPFRSAVVNNTMVSATADTSMKTTSANKDVQLSTSTHTTPANAHNRPFVYGETPLGVACTFGHTAIVTLLLR